MKRTFNWKHEPSRHALRMVLEEAHQELVATGAIYNDAQAPARRFQNTRDLEFAAFICAIIAYGRVAHIKVSIARILDRFGDQPVARLVSLSDAEIKLMCRGWSHRFNTARDLERMLLILREVYKDKGSLESFVASSNPTTAHDALESLITELTKLSRKKISAGDSFWFFLPRPSKGSACKRLNLYLRWMVGRSSSDFGLWNCLSPAQLIIPVDTHVHNQALRLGFTKRKSGDWKTAEEITAALRLLDAEDPTRFDFAICHLGIRGFDIPKLAHARMEANLKQVEDARGG